MASTINGTSTGNGGLISTGDDSGILNIQTNETTAISIDASQRIGIGTTSPSNILDIVSASNPTIRITDTTNNCYTELNATDTVGYVGTASNHAFAFTTNNTERMRIDSSGRVCIGVTSAAYSTACVMNVNVDAVSASGGAWVSKAASTSTAFHMNFQNGNGGVGGISTSGSATQYVTSSDYRLKNSITPMTGALAKIAQLKPVIYKWNSDNSDGEGFIAHELAEICPHAVTGEKDAIDADGNPKYQGIDVSFLVATLTAAIQELKAINDTQAETINALTARIVALETA
jgi:hypothetical protein